MTVMAFTGYSLGEKTMIRSLIDSRVDVQFSANRDGGTSSISTVDSLPPGLDAVDFVLATECVL